MPNIAIVWDFDGTLTPDDSTTKVVEALEGKGKGSEFWGYIKSLRGDTPLPEWEHILASDAPIWMYSLARIAFRRKVPLNTEFFREFVLPNITLFPNVVPFLRTIKNMENLPEFREMNLHIHHFIVSAGLKDLIQQVFPDGLITWVFGCRYTVVVQEGFENDPEESVPVFCMDETMKTRALFEISKGSFNDPKKHVNRRVPERNLWASFRNIIYIGDSDTDVPALALTRDRGGLGVGVFNPLKAEDENTQKKLKKLRINRRADLITPANFSEKGELFDYLKMRCIQIRQRYAAEKHT